MSPEQALRLAIDPCVILEAQGMTPDPWQREFLLCEDRRQMLLCTRGAGKSRTASAKALHKSLTLPRFLVILLARAQRQASELFRYCKEGFNALGRPMKLLTESLTQLEFENGSRIVTLPGTEETIRGYQGAGLIIKDEAARIPDDLNRAVTPMLAVSKGMEIDLTTPFGQRGWFWKKWHDKKANATKFRVPWQEVPRHTKEFIDQERNDHGESWVSQEYECSFEALSGLVYPDFATRCGVQSSPSEAPTTGGIDFGFRNPFAALWGFIDADDVLWLTGERYKRGIPIHEHAAQIPKGVTWYADPAGANELSTLAQAGHTVKRGRNDIAAGIAAVTARIQTGRLRVVRGACPNLLEEAALYRYDDDRKGERVENPVDEYNHALGALRYMVSRIDRHFVAKWLRDKEGRGDALEEQVREAPKPRNRIRELMGRDELWGEW